MVHGAHALAQTFLRRQASFAVRAQIDASVAAARAAVANAIAAGADPQSPAPVVPAPVATCRLASGTGCAIEGRATIAFASSAPASPRPCASDACSIYEQGNDAVDEGRIGAVIEAQAVAGSGAILAARTATVTFRTTRIAPYAVVAGRADGTTDAVASAGSGDDGGAAPDGAAPGTLIDVLYENRATGATLPANVWRPLAERPGATPPAWSP